MVNSWSVYKMIKHKYAGATGVLLIAGIVTFQNHGFFNLQNIQFDGFFWQDFCVRCCFPGGNLVELRLIFLGSVGGNTGGGIWH